MTRKTPFYTWSAKIKRQSLPALQQLAGELGYIVDAPGSFNGQPSAPQMLDAIAAAYIDDPDGLVKKLRSIGLDATQSE